MTPVLYDADKYGAFRPFTLTRAIADMRIGIMTIREKWSRYLATVPAVVSGAAVQDLYRLPDTPADGWLVINATALPTPELAAQIRELTIGEGVSIGGEPVAAALPPDAFDAEAPGFNLTNVKLKETSTKVTLLHRLPDLFQQNGTQIEADFKLLTHTRTSVPLPEHTRIIGDPSLVFIEPGAEVLSASLNTTDGPIYIGEGSKLMEGTVVRGPFAICDSAQLKMSAKIYGGTTIGPYCKVGGEVNNCLFFSYSNKGHDGFLGNSVVGEWCNIGADTNSSNLKNDYGIVNVWDYAAEDFLPTDTQFCGLFMGDHSKCGINTMFNTGTVIGVSANIFGGGFPPKFIPSFSWGGADGFELFREEKAYKVAEAMMQRRKRSLSDAERRILHTIFTQRQQNLNV